MQATYGKNIFHGNYSNQIKKDLALRLSAKATKRYNDFHE
jgi:hypothetical protein